MALASTLSELLKHVNSVLGDVLLFLILCVLSFLYSGQTLHHVRR